MYPKLQGSNDKLSLSDSSSSHPHFWKANATRSWPTQNLGICDNFSLPKAAQPCKCPCPHAQARVFPRARAQRDVWWCITKIGLPVGRSTVRVRRTIIAICNKSSRVQPFEEQRDHGWTDGELLQLQRAPLRVAGKLDGSITIGKYDDTVFHSHFGLLSLPSSLPPGRQQFTFTVANRAELMGKD